MPRLKKALGQHHLRHPHLCREALDFLGVADRTVIEIGPGGGALTGELLDHRASVIAWEVDLPWAFELGRVLARRGRIVAGDALALPWERLPAGTLAAGNLPYGVATALVEALLARGQGVERAAFLVQEEVAARICAGPGSRSYGLLSVMVEAQAEATLLARVSPGSFRPPPKVAGAFVGITRRAAALPTEDLSAFRATVGAAFRHRRKTLLNALSGAWGRQEAQRRLSAADLDSGKRAENLSVADFVALHRTA
ncbi:MAG: 16S rRNA (adenine(1518)-N(6)/adenine(1519)-N(6))-dimethyltransferase RsmA [Acidobacteriota bacterium]|nr:16S rRNA (adenine(1518)-N(6)/adenine(1519)-N(6))-dimethyltransferase RsmA [Acidobacteriota bacterium]